MLDAGLESAASTIKPAPDPDAAQSGSALEGSTLLLPHKKKP